MINYDMIVDLVAGMKEKHPRRRVETILREEGSDILRLPMGTSSNAIKGFLQKNNHCYITVVNSDLNENIQDKILFHELGHLVLKHQMAGDAVCQMRPDNTGIKSGCLQNNFRIDKNAQNHIRIM